MLFDGHAHLLSADRERYPPSPLSGQLSAGEFDAPMTVERLLSCMDAQGVRHALAVQRAHVYGFNNAYMLDSVAQNPERLAAMCMLNATEPDAPELVRRWVRHHGVVGVRMTEPSKGADAAWFASEEALRVWRVAADHGASIRLHFYRWNRRLCLPALSGLLERMPDATVVLDHLSNLSAEEGHPHHGVDAELLDLVRFPNVHLLFSTINLARLRAAAIPAAPVIQRAVQAFGPERVLWGSDVGQSKGSYAELVGLAREAVASLDARERVRVLHDNAARLYWRKV